MNGEPLVDPRERIKCACPRLDASDCVRVRYPSQRNPLFRELDDDEEPCGCACHEDDPDDCDGDFDDV